jgi:hypothetical protein
MDVSVSLCGASGAGKDGKTLWQKTPVANGDEAPPGRTGLMNIG